MKKVRYSSQIEFNNRYPISVSEAIFDALSKDPNQERITIKNVVCERCKSLYSANIYKDDGKWVLSEFELTTCPKCRKNY